MKQIYYNISKTTVPLKDLWMKTSITWILFIEKSCFDYYLYLVYFFLDYILSAGLSSMENASQQREDRVNSQLHQQGPKNQMGGVHHMNHETFLCMCTNVERHELSLRIHPGGASLILIEFFLTLLTFQIIFLIRKVFFQCHLKNLSNVLIYPKV